MQRWVKSETTTPLRITIFTLVQCSITKVSETKLKSSSTLNWQNRMDIAAMSTVTGRGVLVLVRYSLQLQLHHNGLGCQRSAQLKESGPR